MATNCVFLDVDRYNAALRYGVGCNCRRCRSMYRHKVEPKLLENCNVPVHVHIIEPGFFGEENRCKLCLRPESVLDGYVERNGTVFEAGEDGEVRAVGVAPQPKRKSSLPDETLNKLTELGKALGGEVVYCEHCGDVLPAHHPDCITKLKFT